MAVSRVGGARSKIAGQVGSTIYQIRKNADGTYTQIVYAKGERVETTITPKLQAQRMCMAMVESLMRDLKNVGSISFESGKNKSQSLNAFSSWNTYKVNNDCHDHWYSDNKFVYPWHLRTDVGTRDLGGPWIISSGSLNRNIFDAEVFENYPASIYENASRDYLWFSGVKFNCQLGVTTIEQFRQAHKMTVRDMWCFVGFREIWVFEPDPDDPQTTYQHQYILAQINPRLQGDTIITADNLADIFLISATMPYEILITRDHRAFAIGNLQESPDDPSRVYNQASFSVSYFDGKKRISSSTYHNPEGGEEPWLWNWEPCNVFGSWMGEPTVIPYPSPF